METSANYTSHIGFMKQLKTNSSREAMQTPYSKDFEAIYQEAQQKDVKLSNAKEFLNTLSKDQLSTLQHYTGLADSINVDQLSNEGAYNLLMHDYEKYDFNGDGMVQNGIGNMGSVIPTNMSNSMKQSYVDALNSLDESQRLDAIGLSLLSAGPLNVAGNHSTPYSAKPLTYDLLASSVNAVLHPTHGAYSSPELQNSISLFWENFQKSYNN